MDHSRASFAPIAFLSLETPNDLSCTTFVDRNAYQRADTVRAPDLDRMGVCASTAGGLTSINNFRAACPTSTRALPTRDQRAVLVRMGPTRQKLRRGPEYRS